MEPEHFTVDCWSNVLFNFLKSYILENWLNICSARKQPFLRTITYICGVKTLTTSWVTWRQRGVNLNQLTVLYLQKRLHFPPENTELHATLNFPYLNEVKIIINITFNSTGGLMASETLGSKPSSFKRPDGSLTIISRFDKVFRLKAEGRGAKLSFDWDVIRLDKEAWRQQTPQLSPLQTLR